MKFILFFLLFSCSNYEESSFEEFYKKNNSLFSVWEIISIRESNKIEVSDNCFDVDLIITLEAKYSCYYEKKDGDFVDNLKDLIFDKKINVEEECRNSKEINNKLSILKKALDKLKGKDYCYKNILGECNYYPLDNINFLKLKNKKQKEFSEKYMHKKVDKNQVLDKKASISYCLEENLFSLEYESFDD